MAATRIVVIEDEAPIRRGVADALRTSGYEVVEAADGDRGLEEASRRRVDLVLLDLLLPGRDGWSVLGALRQSRPTLPVIILTARGSEEDRVRGLRLGADDYVVKPFSARELLARVEAVLRRSTARTPKIKLARLGSAAVDFLRREIRWHRRPPEELSETEHAILGFLLANRQRAVSREELLNVVWGISGCRVETRAIDMHVARLRSKLRDPAGKEDLPAIVTVRACGYMAGTDWRIVEEDGGD